MADAPYVITPGQQQRFRSRGVGTFAMGVRLPVPYVLCFARFHFIRQSSTAGTETGAMTIDVASDMDSGITWKIAATTDTINPYNHRLFTFAPNPGVGVDVNFRIQRDEREEWQFQPDESIVFSWTVNADSVGEIAWAGDVCLYPWG